MLRSILAKRIITRTGTSFSFSSANQALCTFAIQTKMPVFPMSKHVVQLTPAKFKVSLPCSTSRRNSRSRTTAK